MDGESVESLTNPAYRYYYTTNERDGLTGFFCFGEDAQVPAGKKHGFYKDNGDILDVGLSLAPDLTSKGCGLGFLNAGLEFARQTFHPFGFRLTVASFNQRAIRLYLKAGFKETGSFPTEHNSEPLEFLVMERDA